jgi:hypothetical protein
MFDTMFRGLAGRPAAPRPRGGRKAHTPTSFRPQVEKLEDRTVPAAIRDLTGFRANIILPNVGAFGLPITTPRVPAPAPTTVVVRGGFTDDGSFGPIDLGFNINFFGTRTNSIFLNNNGNITLGQPAPLITPGITNIETSGVPIIAPFFADVDTLPIPSEPVTYGVETIGGHNVFGIDWINVMYSNVNGSTVVRLNQFQLILIDRNETGAGNFDIEFNYDRVVWEVGDTDAGNRAANGLGPRSALAGFSDGTGLHGHYFLLPGSGAPGQLLDSGIHALVAHMLAAATPGRYHFLFRGGIPVGVLPGIGVNLTPFVKRIDPFRFVLHGGIYSGRFLFERTGGTFATFLDDLALDEVGVLPINSVGPPITLVFTRLPKGVLPANLTGFTAAGFPFVTLPANELRFAGDRFRTILHFVNPQNRVLGTFYLSPFRIEVFVGPFDPTTA